MNAMNEIYAAAVEQYGREVAEKAAEESIAAWNVNAMAGFSPEVCAAEQIAAFQAGLQQDA